MDLERCFEIVSEAASAGTSRPVEPLSEAEVTAVLDLARAAAHGVERKAAPVVCYAIGRALAEAGADDRLALLADLVKRLEAETDEAVTPD